MDLFEGNLVHHNSTNNPERFSKRKLIIFLIIFFEIAAASIAILEMTIISEEKIALKVWLMAFAGLEAMKIISQILLSSSASAASNTTRDDLYRTRILALKVDVLSLICIIYGKIQLFQCDISNEYENLVFILYFLLAYGYFYIGKCVVEYILACASIYIWDSPNEEIDVIQNGLSATLLLALPRGKYNIYSPNKPLECAFVFKNSSKNVEIVFSPAILAIISFRLY